MSHVASENTLNYYSATLLKEAMKEMGYYIPKNITKKELINMITHIIQNSKDGYDEDDEDDIVYNHPYE
jgi:hypothetical protein